MRKACAPALLPGRRTLGSDPLGAGDALRPEQGVEPMNVHAQTKNRRGDLIPVIVTVIVAVVGTAGILNNLRAGTDSQDTGNAGMISSAAVSRVGAIEIPSEPPAGRAQR